MSEREIAGSVLRVGTQTNIENLYRSAMQSAATVLVDTPETTAYVTEELLVVLFAEEVDITPILDQAETLGFTKLVRQWEDFTMGRTGMEFAR